MGPRNSRIAGSGTGTVVRSACVVNIISLLIVSFSFGIGLLVSGFFTTNYHKGAETHGRFRFKYCNGRMPVGMCVFNRSSLCPILSAYADVLQSRICVGTVLQTLNSLSFTKCHPPLSVNFTKARKRRFVIVIFGNIISKLSKTNSVA